MHSISTLDLLSLSSFLLHTIFTSTNIFHCTIKLATYVHAKISRYVVSVTIYTNITVSQPLSLASQSTRLFTMGEPHRPSFILVGL